MYERYSKNVETVDRSFKKEAIVDSFSSSKQGDFRFVH